MLWEGRNKYRPTCVRPARKKKKNRFSFPKMLKCKDMEPNKVGNSLFCSSLFCSSLFRSLLFCYFAVKLFCCFALLLFSLFRTQERFTLYERAIHSLWKSYSLFLRVGLASFEEKTENWTYITLVGFAQGREFALSLFCSIALSLFHSLALSPFRSVHSFKKSNASDFLS